MKFLKPVLLAVFSILCLCLLLSATSTKAADGFIVDSDITYEVQTNGKTIVTHDITIENEFTDLYVETYKISLENIDATNIKSYSSEGTTYPVTVTENGNSKQIKVLFPDEGVGKGVKRHFTIYYENSSFAVRTGEVWEVSLPGLDDSNYRSHALTLKIPKSFGLEAYISPTPNSSESNDAGYIYTYDRDTLKQNGISAGYGQFQVFSFNLSYHLENPLTVSSTTEIALPPDTAFQKIYIQKIDPLPTNIKIDDDGNWIAIYDLSPRQRVDVSVSGSVQIFASYRSFSKPDMENLNSNLQPSDYWQTDNPKIKQLAATLKTPQAIYNYVSQTLHYDVERVQPNVQRFGAVAALENPEHAICMEFTDLFIAIARAAGIPAREVQGFAYTENSDLQPLGLVADVLHSWPEYYDKDKGVWIPIDPTWGSTSGVDYFNKLDLRHFTFVIHGKSATQPYPPGSYKLGTNPQKDVYVSFGQLPENRITNAEVSIEPFRVLPFFSSIYTLTIKNPGPAALYSIYPIIYYDSAEKTRDYVEALPPYSSTQIQITLPHSFLGKDMPGVIKASVGSAQAEILTNKKRIVLDSLIVVSVFLILIIAFIYVKVRKIKILAFFDKIRGLKNTKDEKTHPTPPQDSNNA